MVRLFYLEKEPLRVIALPMAKYAIATAPLIHRLSTEFIKQIWYADDTGAGGKLEGL